MRVTGGALLQAVAARIIERYLLEGGATGVMLVDGDADPLRLPGVDDQDLVFYRAPVHCYAFETISHHLTRDPGWMVASSADELYYYFLALDQTEDDIAVLMDGPDEAFFSDLSVERDDLHVLPMAALRTWFGANGDAYMPRPVKLGDHSGWYRIVPVSDIDGAVPGVVEKGSVFSRLSHR
jgi:hypothetical protein